MARIAVYNMKGDFKESISRKIFTKYGDREFIKFDGEEVPVRTVGGKKYIRTRKRYGREIWKKKRKRTKKNPGMGMLLLLGGGALAVYLLTKKKDKAWATPGSQTFVGPMPQQSAYASGAAYPSATPAPPNQDDDLPPVPDPMSNYNYIRG